MNYKNLYQQFISTRPIRVKPSRLDGSLHRHHILPKSLGGTDSKDNLIVLTHREHYFAHKLLYKMNTGLAKSKMAGALILMLNDPKIRGIITSRRYAIEYDKHRQYNIEQAKSHWQTPEYRAKWYRGRHGREAPKAFLSADYITGIRHKPKHWPHSTDMPTRIELLKKKWTKNGRKISYQQEGYIRDLMEKIEPGYKEKQGYGYRRKRTRAEQDALNARVRLGVLKYWTEARKDEARSRWTDERRAVYSARMKKSKIHLYRKA